MNIGASDVRRLAKIRTKWTPDEELFKKAQVLAMRANNPVRLRECETVSGLINVGDKERPIGCTDWRSSNGSSAHQAIQQ
jgi:hypothetical protein